MIILFNTDSATGAAKTEPPLKMETDAQRLARLEAENAELRAIADRRQAEDDLLAAQEKIIAEKTRVGLTRAQAVAVIKRQKDYDDYMEAQWAARRPRIIELLQRFRCTKGEVPFKARLEIRKVVGAFIVLDEIVAAQKSLEAAPAAPETTGK